jgi:hypothetical protein
LDDHDSSDAEWQCFRADELGLAAKLAYYGWKLWQSIRVPPP